MTDTTIGRGTLAVIALCIGTTSADGLAQQPPGSAAPGPLPPVQPAPLDPVQPAPLDPTARAPLGSTRSLEVPEAAAPPVIDGDLSDAQWQAAALADRFWISEQERWPSEPTEARVISDRTHLYVAFHVFDSQPESIDALQTRRDGALGIDDQVTVQLDPYLTYREISSFSVNAIGTQTDSFAGGRARQLAWKGDWKAAVSRTADGWTAEMAIPYEILNIVPGTHTIAVNFVRYHRRTAETSRWADITVRALPEHMGQMVGLRPSEAGKDKAWTFLPYVTVGRRIPDRRGRIRDKLAAAGVDIRYEPRPNLTGVISLLPDFSQVERSVQSINFSYNEKFVTDLRPFFQEGAAYFGDIPTSTTAPASAAYFYSNRVPAFDVGAKAFGRTDRYQFGTMVTRAADDRTDLVATAQRQFGATRTMSAMLVATDRPDLRNQLLVLRGAGREPSGWRYAFDAAGTHTDPTPADGTYGSGTLGWGRGYGSVGATLSRYSRDFNPANGLLARDLLDTRGGTAFVSYYRDRPEGLLREVQGDLSYEQRETAGDGRLQRRKWYAAGSVELREQEVRLGASYSAGPYRPVGAAPGAWSSFTNDDRYGSLNVDFNTRSSRLFYGFAIASGQLGGGDYRYTSGYVSARPTRTIVLNLTSELLENFGSFRQTTLTGNWDVTPQHALAGRYITAFYGKAYRLAYAWRARRNLDFFAVYDHFPGLQAQLSAKVLMTY